MIGKAMGKWHVPMENNRNMIGKLQEIMENYRTAHRKIANLWKKDYIL